MKYSEISDSFAPFALSYPFKMGDPNVDEHLLVYCFIYILHFDDFTTYIINIYDVLHLSIHSFKFVMHLKLKGSTS